MSDVESTTKPLTPRARARAQTIADIVRLGREHLAKQGAAALSLRAVARDLGVVSSAVYRYVESRDELLTLLLVDAYNELGDAVDAALDACPEGDHRRRFAALAHAVRSWALREPARYGLLFGSPVPGYQAPAERTTEPGTRVVRALIKVVDDAYREQAGAPAQTRPPAVGPGLHADFEAIRTQLGSALSDDALARGTLVWTALFGTVSFEVFGQYGPETFRANDELFDLHVEHLAGLAGLG
ncbi:WHG domain-containing protein [Pseudarthrobacter sp. J75]|uniref:TetR/AcrR family transcriptional regulator n=1 Tax=unclassified Pseudarthrobacter TaxID=2647000 RepID=UPI002E81D6D1|nr:MULTISPECIES: WHG domain-containing protein [unclassified Pseudarthrobacter]MEE2524087.1 WHG domain-containing protein [Pseudarthrobacter sp. J47]MEE2530366.1 WHG domain-containing protein [Pseudarthrobacter sp. J75]